MRILVTGGAGFVGSHLALNAKREGLADSVIALDNLDRRGSELAVGRLAAGGVEFVRGDVRSPADLARLPKLDLVVDCAAEPSVHAGYRDDPRNVIDTNLVGTANCLERARVDAAGFVFLSTSRVYPIAELRAIPLEPSGARFEVVAGKSGPGWSAAGIASDFPMGGPRSLYGATKLASEHLVEEYAAMYDMPAVIDRCGVIAGPWQMGRVDQGFVAHWAARHRWGGALSYRGFGGTGLQVRDVLHVSDLYDLVSRQITGLDAFRGKLYCVGGGPERSISLRELTWLCQELSGRELTIGAVEQTDPADVPYFVTDISEIGRDAGWKPTRSVSDVVRDVFAWLEDHDAALRGILG